MPSRKKIETTGQELVYRNKYYHDIRTIKEKRIACSSCGNKLNLSLRQIFSHPWIGILQCEQCHSHFKRVNAKFGKDKTNEYCYICGGHSKLYECGNNDCSSAFCKKCIKRNVNLSLLDAEKEDWKCFICNPKPIWQLRAVCAAVMSDLSKKDKSSIKHNKNTLPSQQQRLKKTKEVQKALKALCDEDDNSDRSDNSSFVTARSMSKVHNRYRHIKQETNSSSRKTISEVNLVDSSTEGSSTSDEKYKQRKSKKSEKAESTDEQNSSDGAAKKNSKLNMNRKHKSKRNRISDDSDDDYSEALTNTAKQKHTIKHRIKETKGKTSNHDHTNMSASGSENDSINEASTSKSFLEHRKKGKIVNSHDIKSTKDKLKKQHDSSNESEGDIEYKKQTKKKSSTNTLHSNKEEQKHEKHEQSSKRRFSEILEDNSDASSGKEFQKIKIQKVHGDKYSKRQLVDLEVDYTKPVDSTENEKNVDEQTTLDLNEAKEILKGCKRICLNFATYIDSIELQYGRKDEEHLLLKSTEKINKFKTRLEKKQKDLTAFCQSWLANPKDRRNITRKLHKVANDSKKFSERTDPNERAVSESKSSSEKELESKNVSECDSDEIFSADETRTPQKLRAIRDQEVDVSRIIDDLDDIEVDKNETSMDKSKNNDNDSRDLQDEESAISPVLGTSKEKITTENTESIRKQLFPECVGSNGKEASSTDEDPKDKQAELSSDIHDDENTVEHSPVKDSEKKTSLQNDDQNNFINSTDIINESLDLFDTSFILDEKENEIEAQETDTNNEKAETNDEKTETSNEKTDSLSKTKSLDTCETSLRDEIQNEKNNASALLHNDGEEKDLSSQDDDQEKMVSASSSKKTIHDVSKETDISKQTNLEESVDDAEILAKEALEIDFDIPDNAAFDTNIAKQIEDSAINANLRKDEDNYSDISSNTSTVILQTFTQSKNDAKSKAEVSDAGEEQQSPKKSGEENEISQISDEANTKKEQAAKKALLESRSEDSSSVISSSLESADETDERNKLDVSKEDAEAKKALLASSNSESLSSELSSDEAKVDTLKIVKNTRHCQIDDNTENSLASRMKRRRLRFDENYHCRRDEKLRTSSEVRLQRLNSIALKRYSHALKKSREYLDQKLLKSLVNLDKLEKRYKKNKKKYSDASTDDDKTSASTKISKISNKQKGKETTKEETLMDHLKKIENGEVSATVETDSNSDDESVHKVKNMYAMPVSNEVLMSEANKAAKDNLLQSSDSDAGVEALDSDENINNDKNKILEDKKKKNQLKSEDKASKKDDGKKEKSDKSNWRRNKILTIKFSDSDSETEKKKFDKKREKMSNELEENSSNSDDKKARLKAKKKKMKRRILDSDSDVKLTDRSSDSADNASEASQDKQSSSSDMDLKKGKQKRKRRRKRENNSTGTDSSISEKRSKPKRRRIKKVASDSDSTDADIKNSQGSTSKSGRKNIRKVLKDKQVAEDTKLAAKEEEERLKRIVERQALYNEVYEMRLAGEEKVDKLVLDFDTETKKELISVHKELVKRLKPHQAQGIKFMWDACFESLERAKSTSGSGCIIAHCMGLGKTLQVIALTHTLLTHEATGIKTVLIVCPLSTVLNWLNEYNIWLKDLDDINVYELTKFKKNFERKYQLQNWQKTGGVMIMGYEMFRNLTGPNKNIRKGMKEIILEYLVDPGADLIVCDEGHLLKNEDTALSKCMRQVKTMRRIVLTGTPLQNNLIEYHCMVQFVKPNLLGTKKEFLNRFVNPITNGQFDDSTAYDVKLMKKRAHVLHKMLEGSVQRFDYSVLTPFLPPKQEYVIFIRLTDTQIKMYQYYLANLARRHHSGAGGTLFADFQSLQRIWTHPIVLRLNAEKVEKANWKKGLSDSEGSLKDFINDDSTGSSSSNSNESNSDSDVQAIEDTVKRRTRNNPGEEEPEEETKEEPFESEWWSQFVQPEHFEDMRVSVKLLLLFGILKESEQIGDKVLVFSQSLYSLTLIEEFLSRIDDETQKDTSVDKLDNHTGSWSLGLDYFRLDGQTSAENRSIWCKIFNRPTNTRARLFLISTRAGGLGINLTAANRVIIFDASWNPSHDVQSIFRIYRFGQKKPCYVYRFLAAGTMEEKIYNRQVTKLSLSCRVVDEQQIERHYSNHNLNELYMFEPYNDEERPTLNLPKDRLLAEIFLKYKDVVENYHEHDSLLENKAEEELDEEERKQAWLEYEEEKKGKPLINSMITPYQNNVLLQQYNMMMNAGQSGMISQGMSLQMEYENLQQLIRKDYPNATPDQQKAMTNRALMEMYNYWEKQATLYQPARNLPTISTNFQQRPMMPHTVTNSNIHQTSQLNQLLKSGQTGNYVNKSVQPNVQAQRDMLPNPYRKVASINNTGKADDDIIEVLPTTSNANTLSAQVVMQSTSKNNNQEE